ncbi:patatin-like phospholipase family protein [Phragmitibacter flavus]|nr:patatin-like phospholipase family protein [Phragmitibacter flavus]
MSARSSHPGTGIAVALSSSFYGFYAHSAFMGALHEAGIFPDQIAGTSSGAFTAAICGMGLQGREIENFTLRPGLRRSFIDWAAPLRFPGVASSLYSSGILSGNNAVKYLREQLQSARLENFQSPRIQIAVTNLTKRESRLITEGDAAEWVIASCSIPGLFCNRVINGERWCDGGVALHVPFDHWIDDPSIHTIVIHNIDHTPGTELVMQWPTLSSGFAACHETISKETTDLRLRLARMHGKNLIIARSETAHPKLFPHKQRESLFEVGRATGRDIAKTLHSRQSTPLASR